MLIMGATNAWATDYVMGPGDHFGGLGLVEYDTLLMTGGTIESLGIGGYAVSDIEGTSPLGSLPIDGGIWHIGIGVYGTLNISGGEIKNIEAVEISTINMTGGNVYSLEMKNFSMTYLYGGQINTLASDQMAFWQPSGQTDLNGWIQFFCREYDYDTDARILTGTWEDYSDFSIQLLNIGTIPTYDQIEFHIIPEPGTIILLGLGGIFLKRRISKQ